jgi:hypothetical protein
MKKMIIKVKVPKFRKPVQKKCNTVMKSKRDYTRKEKHKSDKMNIE